MDLNQVFISFILVRHVLGNNRRHPDCVLFCVPRLRTLVLEGYTPFFQFFPEKSVKI